MNIYYFDPSLNCSLFFIALSPSPITLHLSLAFSVFTHYPLTHVLILSHPLLFPLVFFTHSLFLHFFTFNIIPFPSPSPPCITSTVKTSCTPSKLQLSCLYSEWSHVQSAGWKHHNMSRQLPMSGSPGTITTSVPLPITPETAGNYTCTLKLKNGQTIWATQAVTLPPKGGRDGMLSQGPLCFLNFPHQRYTILLAWESWQTSCQLSGDNEP